MLLELDRWQEAADAAEQVATAFPARAYAVLARAYAALGRAGELRAALEQLATAGGEPSARMRLAELRSGDGDLDGARALLEEMLQAGRRSSPTTSDAPSSSTATCSCARATTPRSSVALGRLATLRD